MSLQGDMQLRRWGHHLPREMLLQGDGMVGDTLLQRETPGVGALPCTPGLLRGAEVERGQPSLGKSPAGEKSRNKNSTFPTSSRWLYRMRTTAPPALGVATPRAPSLGWGAGTRLLTLCPAFLALFSFFLLLHPGDAFSNLSIYGQEVRSSGRVRGRLGPWGGTRVPRGEMRSMADPGGHSGDGV